VADELTRIDDWIYDTLKADAALTALIGGSSTPRIYSDVVPQDATFPCVRFDYTAGRDVRGGTLASTRIMVSGLYLIRGIAQQKGYGGTLATIADRIDANFRASSGGPAGSDGVVFSAVREEPFRMQENDNGVQWRHLGGIYRIHAQVA
jgi:hypothetical protein